MPRMTTSLLLAWTAAGQLPAFGPKPFLATRSCPVYADLQARTNPGSRFLTPGRTYPATEVRSDGWTKVDLGQPVGARWTSARCGYLLESAATGTVLPGKPSDDNQCRQRGQFQSHALALSWQPGFCAGHPKATECRVEAPDSPANGLTLHGLWPNLPACGNDYGFCDRDPGPVRDFCELPEIRLDSALRLDLAAAMPSVAWGTCLERHEWWKHGTCRDSVPTTYFRKALDLANQVRNQGNLREFLQTRTGGEVERSGLVSALIQAFGPGTEGKVELQCSEGRLVEIRLSLPRELDAPLPQLLARAGKRESGNCPNLFLLPGTRRH